jgi:hypothetical protein
MCQGRLRREAGASAGSTHASLFTHYYWDE